MASSKKPQVVDRSRDRRSHFRNFFSRSRDPSTNRTESALPTDAKSLSGQTRSVSEASNLAAKDMEVGPTINDYWRQAEAKLKAEKPDIHQHLEKMQQNATGSASLQWLQDALVNQSHNFSGQKPQVSRNIEKTLRAVMVFGSLVSPASTFDPTGASLVAWTGVRSIMQASLSVHTIALGCPQVSDLENTACSGRCPPSSRDAHYHSKYIDDDFSLVKLRKAVPRVKRPDLVGGRSEV